MLLGILTQVMAQPLQPNTPALRDAIRSSLAARGWTRRKLSKLSGVAESKISKLLGAHQKKVSRDDLKALCDTLDLDPDKLSEQAELQLEIVEAFMLQAIVAIDQHVLQVTRGLGGSRDQVRLRGLVSLLVETSEEPPDQRKTRRGQPVERVFEKSFALLGASTDEASDSG
jgi:transcriptional regulator with XRE-family HTH domain